MYQIIQTSESKNFEILIITWHLHINGAHCDHSDRVRSDDDEAFGGVPKKYNIFF